MPEIRFEQTHQGAHTYTTINIMQERFDTLMSHGLLRKESSTNVFRFTTSEEQDKDPGSPRQRSTWMYLLNEVAFAALERFR